MAPGRTCPIEVSAGVVTYSAARSSTARAARDIGDIRPAALKGWVYVQNRLDDERQIACRVQPLTRRFKGDERGQTRLQALPGLPALVASAYCSFSFRADEALGPVSPGENMRETGR